MDAKEYDKIIDKLMQFRGKIPLTMHLTDGIAQDRAYMLRMTVDLLIHRIDEFAQADVRGWIK